MKCCASKRCYATRVRREFSVLAEGRSREKKRAGQCKDLTETGNHGRKVSSTQGTPEHARRLYVSCIMLF